MHNEQRRKSGAEDSQGRARLSLGYSSMRHSGSDIQERAFKFACAVVNFCDTIDDRRQTTRHLMLQLLRAGTSIGANLAEASAGQTKPDFIAKTCVSLKEAREARYWLTLIGASRQSLRSAAVPLIDEARQLVSILTSIVKNARSNPHRGNFPSGIGASR
jgi:four helix bundle protein